MRIGKVHTMRPAPKVAVRATVPLTAQANDAMSQSAVREGLSEIDVINRALVIYNEIMSRQADGKEIVLRSADGSTEKLVIQ